VRELNARIHEIAKARDIPVLPFFTALEDPKRPDRMAKQLTIEGDHPNVDGYRKLGREAWREPVHSDANAAPACDAD
jgi:lysophospholipase L1-like esterase